MKESELDAFLQEWESIKRNIAKLTKEADECKSVIEDYMRKHNTTTIRTKTYTVTKGDRQRMDLSRKDVPDEIWNKYAKSNKFTAITMRKNQ